MESVESKIVAAIVVCMVPTALSLPSCTSSEEETEEHVSLDPADYEGDDTWGMRATGAVNFEAFGRGGLSTSAIGPSTLLVQGATVTRSDGDFPEAELQIEFGSDFDATGVPGQFDASATLSLGTTTVDGFTASRTFEVNADSTVSTMTVDLQSFEYVSEPGTGRQSTAVGTFEATMADATSAETIEVEGVFNYSD